MASAQESFDAEKVRKEIFQTANRNIGMTIMFVAETARILREKRRKNDFEFVADRSLEIVQGNLTLKKALLFLIADIDAKQPPKCEELLKYYLALEKLLNDSILDKQVRICILLRIGSVHWNLGEYKKAIDYFEKGLEICTEIGDQSGIADNNGNIGNVHWNLGEYQKAIHYHNKALEISTEIRDRSGIATHNGNLGNAYLKIGEYKKSIDYYNKAVEISTLIGDRSGMATHNANLGNAYRNLGEYQKAINCFQKSLEISTEIGDRSKIARNNGNLGTAYKCLGEYQKAIDYHEKALEISIEIRDRSGIASINGHLGNAYLSLSEHRKAINYFEKGLEISTEIGDRSRIAANNGNLGNAYCYLGEHQKAIDYCEKGLEISTEIGYRLEIAINNGNLGNVYLRLGQYQKAIDYFEKSLEICTEIGDQSGIASNNGSLGITYFIQGLSNVDILQRAAGYFEESLKYSDQMFSGLAVDEDKISFTKEYFIFYQHLMSCFIFLKRIEAALLVIDLGKAKALHAFLEKRRKSESNMMSDYARKAWERIDKNEEKMQTDEIVNLLDLKTKNSTALLFSFDILTFLNIWVVNGEGDIKLHSCMGSNEEYIYNNLKKLLKFYSVNLNRDSSFYKLESDSTSSERMMMSTQFVRKLVNDEINAKFRSNEQSGDNTPETPDNILRNLFRLLIEPIKDWIKGTKVIIVPDNFLFFLPFCALLDENACRLSENYSVQITPSLHTLVSSITRIRDSSLGFALFVGNPTVGKVSFCGMEIEPPTLPGATKEVTCLAPLFEAQPLVETEATKERALRLINGAGLIHIAAHGEPEQGEILLAPNLNMTEQNSSLPKEDSYLLKQQDIMKIGINARLVVLSCCHTGKGEISSEGAVGLARAFLAAGARSVLATLWRIEDGTTKKLMEYFYDEIFKETSVCEALRTSQKKFNKLPIEGWAPFTIYGEDVKFSKCDIEEIKQKSREMSF